MNLTGFRAGPRLLLFVHRTTHPWGPMRRSFLPAAALVLFACGPSITVTQDPSIPMPGAATYVWGPAAEGRAELAGRRGAEPAHPAAGPDRHRQRVEGQGVHPDRLGARRLHRPVRGGLAGHADPSQQPGCHRPAASSARTSAAGRPAGTDGTTATTAPRPPTSRPGSRAWSWTWWTSRPTPSPGAASTSRMPPARSRRRSKCRPP